MVSRERGGDLREEEETRLTPRNLVHLVNSRLWYSFIVQALKEDIQSSLGIIYDPLDRGLDVSSTFHIYRVQESKECGRTGKITEGRDIRDEKPV